MTTPASEAHGGIDGPTGPEEVTMQYVESTSGGVPAQQRESMNDQLADVIGCQGEMRHMLDALEAKLFGEAKPATTDGSDRVAAPMPEAMQWRVNEVRSGTEGLGLRLKSILHRL